MANTVLDEEQCRLETTVTAVSVPEVSPHDVNVSIEREYISASVLPLKVPVPLPVQLTVWVDASLKVTVPVTVVLPKPLHFIWSSYPVVALAGSIDGKIIAIPKMAIGRITKLFLADVFR